MRLKQVYRSSNGLVGRYGAQDYDFNKDIYGDAIYETSISNTGIESTWQNAWAEFPFNGYVFIGRNGGRSIFSYDMATGTGEYVGLGYRLGICVGEEFKLTFNANGGTISENSLTTIEKKFNNGNIFGTLPEATREGYTFAGWYLGSENGTEITAETFADIKTRGKTVYAKWE